MLSSGSGLHTLLAQHLQGRFGSDAVPRVNESVLREGGSVMSVRNNIVTLASLLTLVTFLTSGVLASTSGPTSKYEKCMNRAEQALRDCLDHATLTEVLCWSRYGYAKLWCTILYGVR
jgi:hypothetical protein